VTVALNPICHCTVHANFSNGELARCGADLAQLRAHPVVAKFRAWFVGKPPNFHAPTARRY
jgi:hypothetical protein